VEEVVVEIAGVAAVKAAAEIVVAAVAVAVAEIAAPPAHVPVQPRRKLSRPRSPGFRSGGSRSFQSGLPRQEVDPRRNLPFRCGQLRSRDS